MESHRYVLVLAGGSGQRFWPLSRDHRPKQVLPLFGGQSLLEEAVKRLDGLVPPERIIVLTNQQQAPGVRSLLPALPEANIIAEPEKRDTAAAIALGAAVIAARDPQAVIAVLPSDHVIVNVGGFQKVLLKAWQTASSETAIVTIGIKPTWPSPSYGYIERGEALPGDTEPVVYAVKRFCEKPTREVAQTFLDAGTFCWNAGMFVVSVPTLTGEFERQAPEFASFICGAAQRADVLEGFTTLPKKSFDYVVMENALRVLNIEALFDWDDVGSWNTYAEYLPVDHQGNRSSTPKVTARAQSNVIVGQTPQHIALLGVTDLIIVVTDDAVLVASKDRAEQLRGLVDALPATLR
ncbi:MAG: NTP transferase domain-containing protein [Verrucomicrobiaceae bacterium]|nr:NTP transferase domain-containing protein [Verrucomicrobiaceae bacterium]